MEKRDQWKEENSLVVMGSEGRIRKSPVRGVGELISEGGGTLYPCPPLQKPFTSPLHPPPLQKSNVEMQVVMKYRYVFPMRANHHSTFILKFRSDFSTEQYHFIDRILFPKIFSFKVNRKLPY